MTIQTGHPSRKMKQRLVMLKPTPKHSLFFFNHFHIPHLLMMLGLQEWFMRLAVGYIADATRFCWTFSTFFPSASYGKWVELYWGLSVLVLPFQNYFHYNYNNLILVTNFTQDITCTSLNSLPLAVRSTRVTAWALDTSCATCLISAAARFATSTVFLTWSVTKSVLSAIALARMMDACRGRINLQMQ